MHIVIGQMIYMLPQTSAVGMAILHRPASNRPAPHGFYPLRRGGGAGTGTGQDFCPDHRGRAVMGIGTNPPRPD